MIVLHRLDEEKLKNHIGLSTAGAKLAAMSERRSKSKCVNSLAIN